MASTADPHAHRLYLSIYSKLASSLPEASLPLLTLLHKTANPQFIHAKYQKQCHVQCHSELQRVRELMMKPTMQKLDAVLRILNPLAEKLLTSVRDDPQRAKMLEPVITTIQDAIQITLDLKDDVRCGIKSECKVRALAKKIDNIEDMGYGSQSVQQDLDSMSSMQNIAQQTARQRRREEEDESHEYKYPCDEVELEAAGLSRESSLGNIDDIMSPVQQSLQPESSAVEVPQRIAEGEDSQRLSAVFENATKATRPAKEAIAEEIKRSKDPQETPIENAAEYQAATLKNERNEPLRSINNSEQELATKRDAEKPVYPGIVHISQPSEAEEVVIEEAPVKAASEPYTRAQSAENSSANEDNNVGIQTTQTDRDQTSTVIPDETRIARHPISQFNKANRFAVLRQESTNSSVSDGNDREEEQAASTASVKDRKTPEIPPQADNSRSSQAEKDVSTVLAHPTPIGKTANHDEKFMNKPSADKQRLNQIHNPEAITYLDVAQKSANEGTIHSSGAEDSFNIPAKSESPTYIRAYTRPAEGTSAVADELSQSSDHEFAPSDNFVNAPGVIRPARNSISNFGKPSKFAVLRQDSVASSPSASEEPNASSTLESEEPQSNAFAETRGEKAAKGNRFNIFRTNSESSSISDAESSAEAEEVKDISIPIAKEEALDVRPVEAPIDECTDTSRISPSGETSTSVAVDGMNNEEKPESESHQPNSVPSSVPSAHTNAITYSKVARAARPEGKDLSHEHHQVAPSSTKYERVFAHPAQPSDTQVQVVTSSNSDPDSEPEVVHAAGKPQESIKPISKFGRPSKFAILRNDSEASSVSLPSEIRADEFTMANEVPLTASEPIDAILDERIDQVKDSEPILGDRERISDTPAAKLSADQGTDSGDSANVTYGEKNQREDDPALQIDTPRSAPITLSESSDAVTYSKVAQKSPLFGAESTAKNSSAQSSEKAPTTYIRSYGQPVVDVEVSDHAIDRDSTAESEIDPTAVVAPGERKVLSKSISQFSKPNRFAVLRQDSAASSVSAASSANDSDSSRRVKSSTPVVSGTQSNQKVDIDESHELASVMNRPLMMESVPSCVSFEDIPHETRITDEISQDEVNQQSLSSASDRNGEEESTQAEQTVKQTALDAESPIMAETEPHPRHSIVETNHQGDLDVHEHDKTEEKVNLQNGGTSNDHLIQSADNVTYAEMAQKAPQSGNKGSGPQNDTTDPSLAAKASTYVRVFAHPNESAIDIEEEPIESNMDRQDEDATNVFPGEVRKARASISKFGQPSKFSILRQESATSDADAERDMGIDEIPVRNPEYSESMTTSNVVKDDAPSNHTSEYFNPADVTVSQFAEDSKTDTVIGSQYENDLNSSQASNAEAHSPVRAGMIEDNNDSNSVIEHAHDTQIRRSVKRDTSEDEIDRRARKISAGETLTYSKAARREPETILEVKAVETDTAEAPYVRVYSRPSQSDPQSTATDKQGEDSFDDTEESETRLVGEARVPRTSISKFSTPSQFAPLRQDSAGSPALNADLSDTKEISEPSDNVSSIATPIYNGINEVEEPSSEDSKNKANAGTIDEDSYKAAHECIRNREKASIRNSGDAISSDAPDKSTLGALPGDITYARIAQSAPMTESQDIDTSVKNPPLSSYVRAYSRHANDTSPITSNQEEKTSEVDSEGDYDRVAGEPQQHRNSISEIQKRNRFEVLRQESSASTPTSEINMNDDSSQHNIDLDVSQSEKINDNDVARTFVCSEERPEVSKMNGNTSFTEMEHPPSENVSAMEVQEGSSDIKAFDVHTVVPTLPSSVESGIPQEVQNNSKFENNIPLTSDETEFANADQYKPLSSHSGPMQSLSSIMSNSANNKARGDVSNSDRMKFESRLPVGHLKDIVSEDSSSTLTPLLDSTAVENEPVQQSSPTPLSKLANWLGINRKPWSRSPSPNRNEEENADTTRSFEITQVDAEPIEDVKPFRSAGRDSFAEFQSGIVPATDIDLADSASHLKPAGEFASPPEYADGSSGPEREIEVGVENEYLSPSEISIKRSIDQSSPGVIDNTSADQKDLKRFNKAPKVAEGSSPRSYSEVAKVAADDYPDLNVRTVPGRYQRLAEQSLPAPESEFSTEDPDEYEHQSNHSYVDSEMMTPRERDVSTEIVEPKLRTPSAQYKIDAAFKRRESNVPLLKRTDSRVQGGPAPDSWEDQVSRPTSAESGTNSKIADSGPRCSFRKQAVSRAASTLASSHNHDFSSSCADLAAASESGGLEIPHDVDSDTFDPAILALLRDGNIPEYVKDLVLQKEIELARLRKENSRLLELTSKVEKTMVAPEDQQPKKLEINTNDLPKGDVGDSAIAMDEISSSLDVSPSPCPLCRTSVPSTSITLDIVGRLRGIWRKLISLYLDEVPDLNNVTDMSFLCDQIMSSIHLVESTIQDSHVQARDVIEEGRTAVREAMNAI